MSYKNLKLSFEKITKNVWDNLKDAHKYNISFGETTISDMILLYLEKLNNPNIRIIQTKQNEESKFGTDWLWWIGSEEKGWIAFAVQAKKYHTHNNRYDSLSHKVSGVAQWQILEKHAQNIEAIPLYALYNYVLKQNFISGIKGLLLNHSENTFGVTVTPLENIKEALNNRGKRNFKFLQTKLSTMPLPDLIDATESFLDKYRLNKGLKLLNQIPVVHTKIPENFEGRSTSNYINANVGVENDNKISSKRVIVIDISDYE